MVFFPPFTSVVFNNNTKYTLLHIASSSYVFTLMRVKPFQCNVKKSRKLVVPLDTMRTFEFRRQQIMDGFALTKFTLKTLF